jgi:hypothetical protein
MNFDAEKNLKLERSSPLKVTLAQPWKAAV